MTDSSTKPLVLIVDDDATIGRVLEDVLQPTFATHAATASPRS